MPEVLRRLFINPTPMTKQRQCGWSGEDTQSYRQCETAVLGTSRALRVLSVGVLQPLGSRSGPAAACLMPRFTSGGKWRMISATCSGDIRLKGSHDRRRRFAGWSGSPNTCFKGQTFATLGIELLALANLLHQSRIARDVERGLYRSYSAIIYQHCSRPALAGDDNFLLALFHDQ